MRKPDEAAPSSPMQAICDRVMRRIALKYGSTTRRDFTVVEMVISELTPVATQEQTEKEHNAELAAGANDTTVVPTPRGDRK